MPLFRSKYPDLVIPEVTIPQLIFGEVRSEDEDSKPIFINGVTGKAVLFGEFRQLAGKVWIRGEEGYRERGEERARGEGREERGWRQ
jgi:hypothetical protein